MKNHTLYRYDWGWDTFERAEILQEYKDDYGETPTDEQLSDYICAIQNDNWNNLMIEIRYHEQIFGEKTYVIKARIGTWRGTFDGGKVITGMYNVICECCKDCDYITLLYKNNQFKIIGHHHDGTNMFIIRELTDKGYDYFNRNNYNQTDREMHDHLFKSHRWSKMVSIFPEIYEWV